MSVPFRNSKLTTVLQDCFSGDGKALLIVSLNPAVSSASESICSLRFASQLNRVELGKATKHFLMETRTTYSQDDDKPTKVNDPQHMRPQASIASLESERLRPTKRILQNREPVSEIENRPRNLCVGQFPAQHQTESRQDSYGPKRLHQAPSGYLRESFSAQNYSFAAGFNSSVSTIQRKRINQKNSRAVNSTSWR